jgi:hypothetical protein
MIAFDPNSLCRQAQPYYYDFLCNEGSVPESIVGHVEQCARCKKQLDRLKEAVSRAGDLGESERGVSSAVSVMLRMHFAYIDKYVTCEAARPFLPSLLDPALQIRIPTPITAHLDKCRKCSEDLKTIRELDLQPGQLRRLSQLFAGRPPKDHIGCSEARCKTLAIVLLAFQETDAEVLTHVCVCPDCREAVYQARERFRLEYLSDGRTGQGFPCEEVTAADIFDYVIPYGLDPAEDQYAKFRESLTSHLRSCPACLMKMQQLHATIYGIAQRTESEVITIYHMNESAATVGADKTDEFYAGFPIRVETISPQDEAKVREPVSTFTLSGALKEQIRAISAIPLARTAAIAAAAMLIAVALFFKTPPAGAITIDQICKALEKARNAYIAHFVPNSEEPIQEQWISRTSGIYMVKTQQQLVLWDLKNKVRKEKRPVLGSVETTQMSEQAVAEIEKDISGSWGLVPFSNLSQIPGDAKWHHAVDDSLETASNSIDIYDLIWTRTTIAGSMAFTKWRFFVDPATRLPQKTEVYQKYGSVAGYVLRSVMVANYLEDSEMRAVIKNTGL